MLRCDFQPVDGNIVQLAIEARDQVVPSIIDEYRFPPHLFRDGIDDVHLKSNQLLRVLRVWEHVGKSTLGISAPAEDFLICKAGLPL